MIEFVDRSACYGFYFCVVYVVVSVALMSLCKLTTKGEPEKGKFYFVDSISIPLPRWSADGNLLIVSLYYQHLEFLISVFSEHKGGFSS